MQIKVIHDFHLVLARLKKYAVIAIAGLTELIDERQIMFLNDACEQTSSNDSTSKNYLIELAFLYRMRQESKNIFHQMSVTLRNTP